MAKYDIEAPHTPEQRLVTIGEVLATGPQLLDEFHWGCMAGVHNGWATVQAESESAARDKLPSSMRDKWSVTEVTKFTPEQIEAYKAAHQE